MSSLRSVLARNIKELREAAGWTQENLAQRAKTTSTTISRVENGSVSTTVDNIEQMAKALGVTASSLFSSERLCPPERPQPGIAEAFIIVSNALRQVDELRRADPSLTPDSLQDLVRQHRNKLKNDSDDE